MKINQYKRLYMVFFVPLLALGWWMAEDEILYPHNHMVLCEDRSNDFSCISYVISEKEKRVVDTKSGGVFFLNRVRLQNGFYENIITTGWSEYKNRNGAATIDKIGSGVKRMVNIDSFAGANYSGNGPCNLAPYENKTGEWSISCISGLQENFKFSENSTSEKYYKLLDLVKAEDSKYVDLPRNAYIGSMLIPQIAFLLLSALLFFLAKAVTFVRYGRKSQ
jgi:hypothetical protein